MSRRALLATPLLLTACIVEPLPVRPMVRREFPPLRYGYLPPLNLNVAGLSVRDERSSPAGAGDLTGLFPVSVVDTLSAMARDRLRPVGLGGRATLRILAASLVRRGDTLDGRLAIRLEVSDAGDANTGFVEARVSNTRVNPSADQRAVLYDMLKSMMDDMNVELEYQIRRELRGWLVEAPRDSSREGSGESPSRRGGGDRVRERARDPIPEAPMADPPPEPPLEIPPRPDS